jgi:hypothetical protein
MKYRVFVEHGIPRRGWCVISAKTGEAAEATVRQLVHDLEFDAEQVFYDEVKDTTVVGWERIEAGSEYDGYDTMNEEVNEEDEAHCICGEPRPCPHIDDPEAAKWAQEEADKEEADGVE